MDNEPRVEPAPNPTPQSVSANSITKNELYEVDKEAYENDIDLSDRNGSPDSETEGASQPVFRTYRRRWFGIVQMFLLNLAVNWGWLTFAPVSKQAAEYYGTSKTGVNWLSIAYQFAFCLCAPFTIKLLNLGPKPSFMAASAFLLVGNWVRYAGSHSPHGGTYSLVVVAQVLIGLAQPFILSAPTCYSDMWFTERGRVVATALATLSNPLGAALAQLITPFWVNDAKDISKAVLYVSIIASVASIPTFFIPAAPPTPVSHTSSVRRPDLITSVKMVCRSPEIWLVLIPFATYIGLFNNVSSLLDQMMEPYGISEDQAGIGGAVLIVVGLLSSAVTSPIFDRHKIFLHALKCGVPIISIMYIVFIWMPQTGHIIGPYIVLGVLGAASFSIIPVALEFLAELSYPVGSEITSTISWSLGQLFGACFIVICDALKADEHAHPPHNMKRSLIFQAIVGAVVVPLPLMLGLFGRTEKLILKRTVSASAFQTPGNTTQGATVDENEQSV
ncbi:hypothetical protein TD95_003998 [Thielaviopsis punctulata]|uniref:Major facilitator superfamily (MFS) profile domain-containing protein n=1 Tax=Thielaviopsis punctulata TaxID=72032 RepID=A0A0F4ZAI7_9PEZI|nr:hypothetical protein TD95_003998 [Thielaviopsis punctulata]